jgi:serine/threonine protein kinase
LPEALLKDQRARTRFKREIRAIAALDHPHIIHAFDAGRVNSNYFLVMEYATGKDLSHWIAAGGQTYVKWSCECIRQAALGLQYAHERGIVHRDIKPSNLLLFEKPIGERPLLKIADFGLARFGIDCEGDPGLTRIGQRLGTSDYVAPEQAEDATRSNIRADIFSLGCTLFELLSGQLPFQGNSPFERLMARFKQAAPRVSSLRLDVPRDLDEIVSQMLDPNPDRRFQTPGEVAEALVPLSWTERP